MANATTLINVPKIQTLVQEILLVLTNQAVTHVLATLVSTAMAHLALMVTNALATITVQKIPTAIILMDLIIAFAKSNSTQMVLVVPISMSATPTHVIQMLRALILLVVTNVLAMMDTVATESFVATSMNA